MDRMEPTTPKWQDGKCYQPLVMCSKYTGWSMRQSAFLSINVRDRSNLPHKLKCWRAPRYFKIKFIFSCRQRRVVWITRMVHVRFSFALMILPASVRIEPTFKGKCTIKWVIQDWFLCASIIVGRERATHRRQLIHEQFDLTLVTSLNDHHCNEESQFENTKTNEIFTISSKRLMFSLSVLQNLFENIATNHKKTQLRCLTGNTENMTDICHLLIDNGDYCK